MDIALSHRQKLYVTWLQALREQWGDKATYREILLEKEIAGGEDLLPLVTQMIALPDQEIEPARSVEFKRPPTEPSSW